MCVGHEALRFSNLPACDTTYDILVAAQPYLCARKKVVDYSVAGVAAKKHLVRVLGYQPCHLPVVAMRFQCPKVERRLGYARAVGARNVAPVGRLNRIHR